MSPRRASIVLLFALVPLCGAVDGPSPRATLQAEAEVWENHLTGMLLPGRVPPCYRLIVRFTVKHPTGEIPDDLAAESVSLRSASSSWTQAVSKPETGRVGLVVLEGIARGCRTDAFVLGEVLDVLVRVKSGGSEFDVRTKATLTYAN